MCEPCEVLPPLSLCVRGILQAFDQYASKDGDSETLSKKELKGMLKEEMGPLIENAGAPTKLRELFDLMDLNGDQKVDFPEFMSALGFFMSVCHDRMHPITCLPPPCLAPPCELPEVRPPPCEIAVCNIGPPQ